MCACLLNCFSHVQLYATLWTAVHQAPLSMPFSRKEYWSGLPRPPPGDLPDPGIEPMSLVSYALQAASLALSHKGCTYIYINDFCIFILYTATLLDLVLDNSSKMYLSRFSRYIIISSEYYNFIFSFIIFILLISSSYLISLLLPVQY